MLDNIKITEPDISWLSNPEIFQVNRIEPFTHFFSYEEQEYFTYGTPSNNTYSLNGSWKFNYSHNKDVRPIDFYKLDFFL